MQDEDFSQPLMNALPPAVVALALAIFSAEALMFLGGRGLVGGPDAIGWRAEAIQDWSVFPPLLDWLMETGRWTSPEMLRFVAYPFVHGSFTHAIFVIVFLLALGKLVGEVFGNLAVLVVFFASAIVGALFYSLTGEARPLVGGYPAVYGLIGAYTFLLWVGYGARGENQYRAFSLIGFLLGLQLIFGVIYDVGLDWIAELAGFGTGLLVTPFLSPGAFARMFARLRQR
ncbi:rhomboid family intramembrane serine protease [Silicimonas algicola]|uniref:Membrane associated rhomboid family serine protease n=1 Tax=Silicimonas algicola TaxID=1826607 RepID=A0A316GTY7_9RHOB|nr:rhomboid family intramembrane serine protease [Silicimonas algicola]AZQ66205.1 rhomboid family intramembrane serine protease [Silicimonas algicola]PWK58517.1 membrane associated rhomboid family serine protease [Silicimonas algicola]